VIVFEEQQDCLCEYANNTTFIPKCKGYYSMKVNVSVTSDVLQNVSVKLMVNGIERAKVTKGFSGSGSETQVFAINQSICLNKGDTVYVAIESDVSPFESNTQLTGVRSFSGSRCGNSGSSCCGGCSSCH
jgi:hypothetical protein